MNRSLTEEQPESLKVIFVYRSLKRGYPQHHLLNAATALGTARTQPLYRLFDLGSYPGLVEWLDMVVTHVHGHFRSGSLRAGCRGTREVSRGTADFFRCLRRGINDFPYTLVHRTRFQTIDADTSP